MWSTYEYETLARLQREEIARQLDIARIAARSAGRSTAPRRWRRLAATTLRAVATWLAPVPAEPTAVEPSAP